MGNEILGSESGACKMKNDNIIYDIIHDLDVGEEDKKSIIEDLNNDPDYLETLIKYVYQQGLERG